MTPGSDAQPCEHCGYFTASTPCEWCSGEVRADPLGPPIRPGRGLPILDLARGLVGYFRASLHLLTRKEYFGRLSGPVAASFGAAAVVFALALWVVHPAAVWLAEQDWAITELIASPMPWAPEALAMTLTIVTVLMLGPVIIQTLTIPFLAPLAEAVEKMLGGPGLGRTENNSWRALRTNVRASSQVLAMQLLVLVPCLLLSFCQLGLVVAILAGAFLNALLWFEVPFTRRGYTIEQRIRIVRHNWARALGFGIAFEIAMAIPFLNLLLLAPAAAVATTTSYFHFEKVPPGSIVRPPPRNVDPGADTPHA